MTYRVIKICYKARSVIHLCDIKVNPSFLKLRLQFLCKFL